MTITVYSNDESLDWFATGSERIAQNVRNIIRTRMFEVPFMREMGINPDFIDSEHQKIKTELASHVREVIEKYEKNATVLDVQIESVDESGNYIIAVELEV